ncbi:hypothetical protein LEP1GSC187_0731 [Leptospira santarosai str. ZUN179]|uniref:Uncharacterized protein n=1 Tax=Leptospira santarosai str. ZUN179 TaxID=1049985 RepID=M6UM35_9LEPT|nr:hypothetical protein LEP1GSC187_0731 [Leptospira santarosai str. ZUN179]
MWKVKNLPKPDFTIFFVFWKNIQNLSRKKRFVLKDRSGSFGTLMKRKSTKECVQWKQPA